MDNALYSTNPHMLGFYEYVIVGGSHEMKQLKQIPEPHRRLLVMKNMSMLLHQIPQEYDRLRNTRFKHAQGLNFQIIFGGRGHGRGHGRGRGRRRGRGGKHVHFDIGQFAHLEDRFRHMLATANHLAKFTKKQYKDFPIMQTMAGQLLQVVQVYREQLDHTFLFGGEDKTLEQHFDHCQQELDHEEKELFKSMVAPHISKLTHLMQTKIDCNVFNKALEHMLDELLKYKVEHQVQKQYVTFLMCVLAQIAHNKYASCLPRVQHRFYLLHEKTKG